LIYVTLKTAVLTFSVALFKNIARIKCKNEHRVFYMAFRRLASADWFSALWRQNRDTRNWKVRVVL